jgi:hypothetical protein
MPQRRWILKKVRIWPESPLLGGLNPWQTCHRRLRQIKNPALFRAGLHEFVEVADVFVGLLGRFHVGFHHRVLGRLAGIQGLTPVTRVCPLNAPAEGALGAWSLLRRPVTGPVRGAMGLFLPMGLVFPRT